MNSRSTTCCVGEAPQPKRSARTRGRASTAQELQTALLRVKDKGLKISITAVAAEAGVVPSLIHNTYPDIAEQIRGLVGRTARRQRDECVPNLQPCASACVMSPPNTSSSRRRWPCWFR